MAEPRIRFALTNEESVPTGGVKQVYRQVDILNDNGFDAAVVVPDKGKPDKWFNTKTRTMPVKDLVLAPDDYVVVPELLNKLPDLPGLDAANVVVYAQNPFNVPRGYGEAGCFQEFYRDRVSAVLCVSEHSRVALSELLPVDVHRIRYSFDRPPFGPADAKQKIISYMPRRRRDELQDVLTMLSDSGALSGWTVESIEWRSEGEVAQWLKKSAIFMSGSYMEGFGMPPAEAMACGCLVVGWHGVAGQEFFLPEITRVAAETDTFSVFLEMKKVLSMELSEISEIGTKASEYIRREYSSEKEADSVMRAWNGIIKPSVEVKSTSEWVPPTEIAAFVSTYDEGPYLENILRWLSPRVSGVYVAESKTSFFEAQSPEQRRTKQVVDVLQTEGIENIHYMELEGQEHPAPDIKEAHERNQALERIEKDGFDWVWIVDADEFYMDDEATALWKWFFEALEKDPSLMGARCSWHTYWRSVHWRVEPPEHFHPNVIIKSSCRIHSSRHLLPEQEMKITEVPEDVCRCRHYSWAREPHEIKRKTETWTHAHQIKPDWFERVFMQWKPGDDLRDFHPTEPEAYRSLVKCDLPIPKALVGHPYVEMEVIEDEEAPRRVKAVILNHNHPENSDKLYEQLSEVFDDVEVFDSGSDPDKIPSHLGRSFENIYWAGGWNEIIRTCSDYDAVWMLGDDIELKSDAQEYRTAIEASLPFGCWSPCVEGRAKPFMQAEHYKDGKPRVVRNMEGMCMAVSGPLMSKIDRLPKGSDGYGQDLWLCYTARQHHMKNVIDGRVKVYHPEGTGYDDSEWVKQMEDTFSDLLGPDWRQTAFQFSDVFEENIMSEERKPFTIVTVDNGWSYPEFIRITNFFPDARKIIMVKGVAEIPPHKGVEIIRYDKNITRLLAEADVALFPKVGAATKAEFKQLLEAKVPIVVHVDYHLGLVKHMENGYHYQVEGWAQHWLNELNTEWAGGKLAKDPVVKTESVEKKEPLPIITVITPTWKRDVSIIKRCIDCMCLQTFEKWEHLICSNGPEEKDVKALVESLNDPRIKYKFLGGERSDTDFGNSARKHMIEEASGQYITFFDDDNLILPEYLQRMIEALRESKKDFAICNIMHFGPLNEAVAGKPPTILRGEPVKLHHVDPLQIMVKADVMKEVGWDTSVGYLSDGVTLEKLGDGHEHVKVKELLAIHM